MRPMKNCPACSHDNDPVHRFCSRCGAKLNGGPNIKSSLAWVGLAFLFFAGSFLFYRSVTITQPAPVVSAPPAQLTAPPPTPAFSPTVPSTPPLIARVPTSAPTPKPTPSIDFSDVATATPTPSPVKADPEEVTVYVTRTGQKYHRAGCQYLSRSMIPMTLADAQAEGYEPCKVCHPPEE
jgi:hypothetical protein